MKFIHTADIHWGMVPDSGKPWSKERAQAVKDTFAAIIKEAQNRQADCLFISGDLFHRQPLAKDLKEINYLFSTIPSVQVVMIFGNHDRIQHNSLILDFAWSSNVHMLTSEDWDSIYLEELNLEVHGFSYHSAEVLEERIADLSAPDDGRIHVLMAHGGDSRHMPFDIRNLPGSFAYIALGHIHKHAVLADKLAAFPGSPEPLDLTETGQHGILAGEISLVTRKVLELEFIPMARTQYIPLIINVTPQTTNMELSGRLEAEISRRGEGNIYRFRIQGKRDPDIQFDLEPLMSHLRIAEIQDESEPDYDFAALFAEHPGDMIGFYIQALQKDPMSHVEKKALYYGIDALIRTTEERG